jgi:hypothetical protein
MRPDKELRPRRAMPSRYFRAAVADEQQRLGTVSHDGTKIQWNFDGAFLCDFGNRRFGAFEIELLCDSICRLQALRRDHGARTKLFQIESFAAPAFRSSMIFSENRFPLFRIML